MLATAGLSRAMAGHGREALRCMQEAQQILIASDEGSPYVAVLLASALTVAAGRGRRGRPSPPSTPSWTRSIR